MNTSSPHFVDVFPITTRAFGFRPNWFLLDSSLLIRPAYLLMVLMLVLSIGIMALKRFEHADLEKKLWNIPIILTAVVAWPFLIIGLKSLVDAFNTFLVHDVFQIEWKGFGFVSLKSPFNIFSWSVESLARLLPNLSYWLIYSFYIVFFFFYAVLGPFIMAKGILFDEIEAFLELIAEVTILFLWQTTLIIFVAFIMPDIVSGKPFPPHPKENFFFLSIILGLMILFVPSITRKFGNHLGSSFFPPGIRWGGGIIALSLLGRMTSASLSAAGIPVHPHRFDAFKHRLLMINEFRKRYKHQHEVSELLYEKHDLERQIQNIKEEEKKRSYNLASFKELNGENHAFDSSSEDGRTSLSASSHYISSSFLYKENDSLFSESPSNKDLLSLSKRAQKEITSIEESSGGDT